MEKSKITTQDICLIALMTAAMAVMAQISIPMPLGVPMTMQTFGVTLAAIILGSKRSTVTMVIYLLLGAVGVPVFANFTGGLQKLIGPTGGFLISFPLMAYIIGKGAELREKKGFFVCMLILGTVSNYVVGVVMFCILMKATAAAAFAACVLPFIPTAVIKAVLAAVLGLQIRKRLSGVLQTA